MPDAKGNLHLFEAIELRNEYDRHIQLLLEILAAGEDSKKGHFYTDREEEKEPVEAFDSQEFEKLLKNLQTKRVKLNQAIQMANFNHHIDFEGEKVSLAEALEIRKSILADLSIASKRVADSAYRRILHKEERDIIHEPRQNFKEGYGQYLKSLHKLRELIIKIHAMNHQGTVVFKEE